MHLFDHQLKWQNAERRTQASTRKKIARRSQGAPKATHAMSFDRNGLEFYHPLAFVTTVKAHSCRIRWGWLLAVNNQMCLSME
jgi:hypothetical protein